MLKSKGLADLDLDFTRHHSRRTGPNPHRESWPPVLGRDGPTPNHGHGRGDPDGMGLEELTLPLARREQLVAWTNELSYHPSQYLGPWGGPP